MVMNIKYAVKNNFLKKEDFENIKNMVMGENFPWYFGDNVALSLIHI